MKNIIINASASSSGGANTIINQFINNIPLDGNVYYIFTKTELKNTANKRFININTQGKYIKRLIWELFGIRNWLRKNKVIPDLFISFQNTGIFFNDKISQIVYYHQPVSLFNYNWKFYKRIELSLFFYKNIYPFIIKLSFNKNTSFVVQLNCIKDSFSNVYNINPDRIHVIRPNFKSITQTHHFKFNINKKKQHFFYPCITISPYKNFKTIFDAIKVIPINFMENAIFHFSCTKKEINSIYDLSSFPDSFFVFHDNKLSYEDVMSLYISVDVILFPSFIETFGLPLLEASFFNKPIIVSDLPYSREVLKNYNNVKFIKYNNHILWAESIQTKMYTIKSNDQLYNYNSNNWIEFNKIIQDKLK